MGNENILYCLEVENTYIMSEKLAEKIHKSMVHDLCHARIYESMKSTSSISEFIFQVVQFLDLHTFFRHQLSYDNLFPVFCHLFQRIRPDLFNHDEIYYATYFIKKDVLFHNLRRR